jgi:hypothetical protein
MPIFSRYGCVVAVVLALMLAPMMTVTAREADIGIAPRLPDGYSTIRVLKLPAATPRDAVIYLVPGLNRFDERNDVYRMYGDADGYSVKLPPNIKGHHVFHFVWVSPDGGQAFQTDENGEREIAIDLFIPETDTITSWARVEGWGARHPSAGSALIPIQDAVPHSIASLTVKVKVPWFTPPDAVIEMEGARTWGRALRQLERDPDGSYHVTLYRATDDDNLSADVAYRITFHMTDFFGTYAADVKGSRGIRLPMTGAQTVTFEIAQWRGFPIPQVKIMLLSLVVAVAIGGMFFVRRYRQGQALTRVMADGVVTGEEQGVGRIAALSETVASLNAEAKELERWSRAFLR